MPLRAVENLNREIRLRAVIETLEIQRIAGRRGIIIDNRYMVEADGIGIGPAAANEVVIE